MQIILNNASMIPIYEQLVDQIKDRIITGKLSEGEALPSVRALSGTLKISSFTVKKAYDKLEEDGFVVTVHGKGTYVMPTNRALAMEARRKAVEEDLAKALEKAKSVGMSPEEIRQITDILLED